MDPEKRSQLKERALLKLKTAPNSISGINIVHPSVSSSTVPDGVPGIVVDLHPPRPLEEHVQQVPKLTFLTKEQREKIQLNTKEKQITQEATHVHKKEQEELSRQLETKALLQSLLLQDASKRSFSGTIGSGNLIYEQLADVDDTDDPEMKDQDYEAWMIRELSRLKRREEELQTRLQEEAHVASIRQLEGEELQAWLTRKEQDILAEKEEKEKSHATFTFLQKYYHGGAFFTEDLQKEDPVFQRNASSLPTASESAVDKSLLPELMQVRNFGKSSRSKWKHLTAEDTTAYDGPWYMSKKKLKEQAPPSNK